MPIWESKAPGDLAMIFAMKLDAMFEVPIGVTRQSVRRAVVWLTVALLMPVSGADSTALATKSVANTPVNSPLKTQFVSLNLCTDRLLQAVAAPEQIAALSPLAFDATLNWQLPEPGIAMVKPDLNQLLPYFDKTIVIVPEYYPNLSAQLKQLGFKILPISLPKNPSALQQLVREMGRQTQQPQRNQNIIQLLQSPALRLKTASRRSLLISHGLTLESSTPQRQFLALLELEDLSLGQPAPQALSEESLMQIDADNLFISTASQQNSLITTLSTQELTDEACFDLSDFRCQARASFAAEQLRRVQNNPFIRSQIYWIPQKYLLCYDQGIWLLAAQMTEKMSEKISGKMPEQR